MVLWFSHILVRHQAVTAKYPPFSPDDWTVLPPPPSRSREEALAIAQRISEEAREQPARFGELARTFSEDATTSERGGSFGGVEATQLILDPWALDALAVLKPGEISRVLETEHGFHVIRRDAVPEAGQLGARHIVIGHDAAPWLRFRRRTGTAATRTRTEARDLARDVAARARASPGTFERLVDEYSEHRDAEQRGDLGVWSTREPAPFPRIIELAATMAIGETSEPLETVLGFEIVQRIAVDSRPAYAMTAIKVHFIPDAPHDHAASKESAFARATSIVAALREKPSRFDEFQRVECCPGVERWTLGRGDPELTEILEMTPLDGLAPRPVVVDYNWVIAKRLQPVEPPDSETRFDLPAPANPDLDYLVRVGKPSTLAKQVTRLGDLTKNQLGLSPDEEASFDRLHREMASKFEMSGAPDERERILATVLRDVEAVLGAKKFQMYMTLLKGAVAEMLLKN